MMTCTNEKNKQKQARQQPNMLLKKKTTAIFLYGQYTFIVHINKVQPIRGNFHLSLY